MLEWVVLLVALVALGLSIAAVAKPCKSDFADVDNPNPNPCKKGGFGSASFIAWNGNCYPAIENATRTGDGVLYCATSHLNVYQINENLNICAPFYYENCDIQKQKT